jgi:O-antigen ligase
VPATIPALLGNIEYTTSLSNRLPLWDGLLAELEKHPWTGAGFAAFWSPENYARLELIIVRSAVSAHNGYLEELLNTGIVRLAHFLRCVVVLWQAHRADPFRWLAFMFLAY